MVDAGDLGEVTADGRPAGRSPRRKLVEAEIYEQAGRLFAERGFAGTTPQDIADAVGVSRQALYYYIKSKDEILAGLVSQMATQNVADMRAISEQQDSPPEALRRLAEHLVRDRAVNRTRFRLLDRSESSLPEELARDYLEGRRAALRIVMQVIERGVDAGFFRSADVRVSALSVIGMCNWVAWWYEPRPDHPVEPVAAQIAASAVAMLQVPVGGTTPLSDPMVLVDHLQDDLNRLKRLL